MSINLTKARSVELFREIGRIFERDWNELSGMKLSDWDQDLLIGVTCYSALFLRGEYKTLDLTQEKVLQHIRDQATKNPNYNKVRKRTTLGIYKLFRELEKQMDSTIPEDKDL